MEHWIIQDVRQIRAIELLVAGQPISTVAKTLGIGRTTLHRWLKEPAFASDLKCKREEKRQDSRRRLEAVVDRAVAAVESSCDAGEVRTAIWLLEALGVTNVDADPVADVSDIDTSALTPEEAEQLAGLLAKVRQGGY